MSYLNKSDGLVTPMQKGMAEGAVTKHTPDGSYTHTIHRGEKTIVRSDAYNTLLEAIQQRKQNTPRSR